MLINANIFIFFFLEDYKIFRVKVMKLCDYNFGYVLLNNT